MPVEAVAVNKVVYGRRTLIDLTNDTVSEDKVVKGVRFHEPSGSIGTGTIEPRDDKSLVVADSTCTVPVGVFSEEVVIHFRDWLWDPFNFEKDLVLCDQ